MQGDEPFGLFTFRAPEGPLWVKWRKVEADMRAEAPALARCRTEPEHCTAAATRFVAIIKEAAVRRGRARLKFVNEQVNAAIRYTSDMAQWHEADVWSAPLDKDNEGSFQTRLGDCEDYAIAKYFALREAGLDASDLRLMLVRDNWAHLDHAVLAARLNGHWLVLDNRWSRLIEAADLKQFVPLFALNADGVKIFAAPYALKPGTAEAARSADHYPAASSASVAESVPVSTRQIRIATLPLLPMPSTDR
jgi:predicted transglutaminase-like cysteine proteinase